MAASCGRSARRGGQPGPGAVSQGPRQAPVPAACSQAGEPMRGQDNLIPRRLGDPSPWERPRPYESRTCRFSWSLFRAQCPARVPGACGPAPFRPPSPREGQALVRREWDLTQSGPAGCGLGPAGCQSAPPISPPALCTPRVLGVSPQTQRRPSPRAHSCWPRSGGRRVSSDVYGTQLYSARVAGPLLLPASSAFGRWF